MSNKNKVMDFNHEKFDEFAKAMVYAIMEEGECCDSTHKITIAIVKRIPGIDIDGTLEFFESLGGRCDCLIISFVVRPYMETKYPESDYRIVPCFCFNVLNRIVDILLKPDETKTEGELS